MAGIRVLAHNAIGRRPVQPTATTGETGRCTRSSGGPGACPGGGEGLWGNEVGKRVASLEEHENTRSEEIEQLQQEILRLQDQQIELQAHAEDLENQSRRNNIRIRGAPTGAQEEDLLSFVQALFHQILREPTEREVCIYRVHRVRPSHAPPDDILACIHNFPLKEHKLQAAREQHPLKFRGHTLLLYQDFAAITLQKRTDFDRKPPVYETKKFPTFGGIPFS
ncbi:hypothetical protein NDU88_001206 [Pleurodeles waltl]|uniref:L1 transposable element RRM domain-containing protein n=1 Tax=Pleurodeles waltl TaxID=8319 RepID=A0AAV7SZV4_PLEWA|nr:hypothetical protein NDU88_001206 [Pleurodeles waltl]